MTGAGMDKTITGQRQILARLEASTPRRVLGGTTLAGMGVFLASLAVAWPPEALVARVALFALAVLSLWAAWRLWHATRQVLELDENELREAGGRVLARIDDIEGIARGAFAIKPSNGFTLRLASSGGFAWAPGLWWRMGRQLGIGGVTGAQQTKMMAEAIHGLILLRD